MDEHTLKRIRRCYDDYSEHDQAAYRAFWTDAHKNMGLLLDEVRRLQGGFKAGAEATKAAVIAAFDPKTEEHAEWVREVVRALPLPEPPK